jgi:hypothetical protein
MTTPMPTHANSLRPMNMPRLFLHLEGLALLIAALAVYASQPYSWWAFIGLLLVPDLPLLLYPINERIGSLAYNLVHTTLFPLALMLLSLSLDASLGLQLALIWLAHIGMDRAVGYGLKYAGDMKRTHFSQV